jgi:hypothetical protein
LQAQQKKHGWYVDSGSSKHIMSDKDRFLTLKKGIYGLVLFGNDNSAKIIGRGIVVIARFSSPYAILHRGPFSTSLCRLEVLFCKSQS